MNTRKINFKTLFSIIQLSRASSLARCRHPSTLTFKSLFCLTDIQPLSVATCKPPLHNDKLAFCALPFAGVMLHGPSYLLCYYFILTLWIVK